MISWRLPCFFFWLLTLGWVQTNADSLPASDVRRGALRVVDVTPEATTTNARRLQVVTVRLKIKPGYIVFATPQPREEFSALNISLKIKTRDSRTQVNVLYPRAIERKDGPFSCTEYEGEVAIQAVIQRAEGDNSPLEGSLRFSAVARTH